jgi:sulfite reductase (NADPH) hemoprotein beta-component
MSGCMNACGHHHVGHIGILGVDKKGEEWYQISLGGSSETTLRWATFWAHRCPRPRSPTPWSAFCGSMWSGAKDGERFLDTFRRIGLEPFRVRAYAPGSNEAKQEEERYAVGY